MAEQSGPNVRRITLFNRLGQGVTVFIGQQADGTWIARNEGGPWAQSQLVPGADPEEAAGAMIALLEETGFVVPEPQDDWPEDRRLTSQ